MIPMVNRIELWTGWVLAAAAAVTAGILIVTGWWSRPFCWLVRRLDG